MTRGACVPCATALGDLAALFLLTLDHSAVRAAGDTMLEFDAVFASSYITDLEIPALVPLSGGQRSIAPSLRANFSGDVRDLRHVAPLSIGDRPVIARLKLCVFDATSVGLVRSAEWSLVIVQATRADVLGQGQCRTYIPEPFPKAELLSWVEVHPNDQKRHGEWRLQRGALAGDSLTTDAGDQSRQLPAAAEPLSSSLARMRPASGALCPQHRRPIAEPHPPLVHWGLARVPHASAFVATADGA